MDIRVMTPQEYNGLVDKPEPLELPKDAVVVGIFKDGRLIARTAVVNMIHLEGTWIAQEERNGMLGARLVAQAEKEARGAGATTMIAYTAEKQHGEYMKRLGYEKADLEVWMKGL